MNNIDLLQTNTYISFNEDQESIGGIRYLIDREVDKVGECVLARELNNDVSSIEQEFTKCVEISQNLIQCRKDYLNKYLK